MKILYYIYQICIALPILLVLTILTAVVTIVGSFLGGAHTRGKKVLETIRQAKDSLKDGVSLVVFPEGARSFTGHMGYFKKGAFQLADDLQLAVVPVTIDGSFEILPRTGKWIHRHRMILTIHDPIPPKGQGADNMKATMAEAYTAVESALPDKFKGMVKNEDQDR